MPDNNPQLSVNAAPRDNFTRITVRVLAAVAAIGLIAWATTACGAPVEKPTVSGTVSYWQPADGGAGTVLIVEIQHVAAAGGPAAVVAEQRIADPGPVPVAFEVSYDPADIDESRQYIVRARVEDGNGTVLYAATQDYAVITQGHPIENIQVVLELIGGTPALL